LGVILQTGEGVDAVSPGADMFPGIIRKGVKVVLGFRITAEQSV